jgi:CubicO group peptidase (beta-lactamase class C family)
MNPIAPQIDHPLVPRRAGHPPPGRRRADLAAAAAAVSARARTRHPVRSARYSSPGFLLAGFIAERACGQPYREYLVERILSPLGLTHTSVGGAPGGAARGYKDGQPVAPFDLDAMPGTGDIWSTAADLTRFTAALHGGELVSASSLRAMCTAHAPIDDDEEGEPRLATTGYGYGMFTGIFAGHAAYYHPGDNPGYQSFACWIPDQAASIVILANDEAASITGLLRQLLPAALGAY